MSFSDEYKAGYSGNPWGVDPFSYSYQMGQKDRERDMHNGSYGSGAGGGGMAGGGGIVFAAVMVIIAVCAFVIALMSYPVAAGATGIVFAISAAAMNSEGAQMNGVGLVFALMVPCFIVFVFAFQVEKKLGHFRPYQLFRQVWRIVVGTFFIYTLGTGLIMDPEKAGFFEYAIHYSTAIAAPFLMYLNSMRLDRKYEIEPIRFRWLERLMSPIKDRLVSKVDENLQDTPVFRVRDTLKGGTMDVQVSNGVVTLGEEKVPVGSVKKISYNRDRTRSLLVAGILLPIVFIVILGNITNEDFAGFFPQLFGLLSLVFGGLLVFWALVENTPPGKFQGPFRSVDVFFARDNATNGQVYLAFLRPEEERAFVQALENGLKAIPVPEPVTRSVVIDQQPQGGKLKQLVRAFKF